MYDVISGLNVHLPGILLAYAVLIIGIASPGPAILAIIGTAMHHGRTEGVALATGVVCGSAFWGIAAAIGLSAILASYAEALVFLKIVGGGYLIWLAWKAFRAAQAQPGNAPVDLGKNRKLAQLWLTGLLIHLTNPKAIITWLATIALGVGTDSPAWVSFAIVLGGIILSLTGNLTYALFFSTKRMSAVYARARRPIQYVFSGFFLFAGLSLLTNRN